MKIVRSKNYKDDIDPPRWEYRLTDGVTSVGGWCPFELDSEGEDYIYRRLEQLLEEERELSVKH